MLLFHNHNQSSVRFDTPEEGGDGLNDMIAGERQEGAIDLFFQESGEDLEAYLNGALAMGSAALSDSHEQES
jgi:hypothetical protein